MKTKAVYPGTFDPITRGHLDVIERASKLFGELTVAITDNPAKKPLFSLKERAELVEACTQKLPGVHVKTFEGLLADFAKKEKCRVIVRGLREMSDFSSEFQAGMLNRKLAPGIETIFILTDEKYFYLNSTVIKELARFHAPLNEFVPKPVEKALRGKMKENHGTKTQ